MRVSSRANASWVWTSLFKSFKSLPDINLRRRPLNNRNIIRNTARYSTGPALLKKEYPCRIPRIPRNTFVVICMFKISLKGRDSLKYFLALFRTTKNILRIIGSNKYYEE